MGGEHSDAFVFFGATGDLAFKQISPALQGLIRDDGFDMPIIGVAQSGDLDTLRLRPIATSLLEGRRNVVHPPDQNAPQVDFPAYEASDPRDATKRQERYVENLKAHPRAHPGRITLRSRFDGSRSPRPV